MRRAKTNKLDLSERKILDSVERGEWRSVADLERQRLQYENYAKATIKKDRRIHIRLPQKDLETLQTMALEEGIPYHTLIASILHNFASGRLVKRGPQRTIVTKDNPA